MMHKGASSKSVEEDEMETSEDSSCKLPFITQELVIVDRSALKHRIQKYQHGGNTGVTTFPIEKKVQCDFNHLDASVKTFNAAKVEKGLQCHDVTYTYDLTKAHQTNDSPTMLVEQKIKVQGVKDEAVTYYFKMNAGFDAATGSGLRILLKRASRNDEITKDSDPFACLMDHSCQEARMSHKNH